MDVVAFLRENAAKEPRTIVLPEMEDKRMQSAAKVIEREHIANLICLDEASLDKTKIDEYAAEFFELRKSAGVTIEEARAYMSNPLFYGAMLVRHGEADAFVAGAANTTADVVRAMLYCIGLSPKARVISGAFIMVIKSPFAKDGFFIFSDCAVVPNPNPKQLAHIGIDAADLCKAVFNIEPRVAFLSFSSKGSAKTPETEKVVAALDIAKDMRPELLIDGEFQVDTALVKEVAALKVPDSPVAGQANVLIFPGLEAGNISYKLVERLAGARAIGPILLGGKRPCSDLSRGCSTDDIVDCVAVSVLRARNWPQPEES